jgi:multiple sugar transport system substrate-binding protein
VIDVNPDTGKENGAVCLEHSGWAAPALTLADKSPNPIYNKISIEPFQGDKANFPNSKPVVLAFNDWLGVAQYSQNQALAADWLKAAFTKEANNKWNETMGLIPSRNDAQYGFVVDNPALKREAELASQYGVGFADIYDSAKLSTIMQEKLGKLVTGELSVDEVLAQIQTEYTQALKDDGVIK